MFYAHYDGQPLDPKEWATPPFEPVLRDAPLDAGGKLIPLPAPGQPFGPEWRIYGRAAADDKVAIVAFAAALDAIRANHVPLKSNLKFIIEGEEEGGSAHLDKILMANRDLLRADAWLICDNPTHQSRRQQIIVWGPRRTDRGHHRLWSSPRTAQRPLWQLGAQSGHDACPIAGFDERRLTDAF